MTDIVGDFEEYTNSRGLLTEWKNPGGRESGNGLLFTSMQLLCYKLHGIDGTLWSEAYGGALTAIEDCRIKPGLYKRSPNFNDLEAHDDLIGISYLSGRVARDILDCGLAGQKIGPFTFHYFYNTTRPGTPYDTDGSILWPAWLGRNLPFVAHLHHCLGMKPPWLAGLAWRSSLKTSGDSFSQDEWVLNRLLIEGFKGGGMRRLTENPDDWEAIRIYWRRFKQAWPGGMGALYARYFQNDEHPLSKHWPKEF